jgi:hypothetical protein
MSTHHGYVLAGTEVLVQIIDPESRWGFYLADADQTWDGGLGWSEWEALADDDPRITESDRERLSWRLQG